MPFEEDERGFGEEEECEEGSPDEGEEERVRRERARVLGKERRPWRGKRSPREEKEEERLLDALLLLLLLLLFVC